MAKPDLDVAYLVAASPATDARALAAFARETIEEVARELTRATGEQWDFHAVDGTSLANDDTRRPSDFLDEATLRMVEGPFELVIVFTDVGVASRRNRVVPGIASRIGRVVIVSTRRLLVTPKREPPRTLASPQVRVNAVALLVHLIGDAYGLKHARDARDVRHPFRFDDARAPPRLDEAHGRALARAARRAREHNLRSRGPLVDLLFLLRALARHPGDVAGTLLRNRAPLLPLSLPSLATAAVVPMFILVFTAEIWDVGLNMTDAVSRGFAVAAILAATWYLTHVQNLFFPRKEKGLLTEHIALVNAVVFLSVLLGVIGLFVMVVLLTLAIQLYVFPPGLISTWPTLEDPIVDFTDKLRIAVFISTVGVLTGSLAGGLESRTVIRHLALFRDDP